MTKAFTILYADDDQDDIYLFCDVIKDFPKIDCVTAENGVEALEVLHTRNVDLIFLDLNMPLLDGYQCLKQIKEDSVLKSIPVVMYSTSPHERDKCLEAGAAAFLVKAQTFRLMKEAILGMLEEHGYL